MDSYSVLEILLLHKASPDQADKARVNKLQSEVLSSQGLNLWKSPKLGSHQKKRNTIEKVDFVFIVDIKDISDQYKTTDLKSRTPQLNLLLLT